MPTEMLASSESSQETQVSDTPVMAARQLEEVENRGDTAGQGAAKSSGSSSSMGGRLQRASREGLAETL